MKDLVKEGLKWIEINKNEIQNSEKAFLSYLETNTVPEQGSVDQYINLLQETSNLFLKLHICFQISTQIDALLNPKILQVFRKQKSPLTDQQIFELCVSNYTSDLAVHQDSLRSLRSWCKRNNVSLQPKDFKKSMRNPAFNSRLHSCYRKGYFLLCGYGGVKFWTLKDEFLLLKTLKRSNRQKKAVSVHLSPEQKKWITIAHHFSETRDRRKSFQQRAFYRMAEILEKIGQKLHISRSDLEFLRIEECTKKILKSSRAKQIINQRKKGYLGYWDPKVGTWDWSGEKACQLYNKIPSKSESMKALKGVSASPGKTTGPVHIILNPRLDESFKKGEILVTGMTTPDFVPLMRKAKAIVTEIGGITCHAAIISRELNLPCVIGTVVATKVLKNGDLVEVDADHGVVRLLKSS